LLPKSLPEPEHEASNRPVIRIASIQQPPERIVIDTSQPTIVPPSIPVDNVVASEPTPSQSYAAAPQPPPEIDSNKKAKVIKRQGPKVASHRPPLASTTVTAIGRIPTTASLTRLSFAEIISGRLVRNLFNLN
jgi:hypothetical protein